jgi:hypothetical protein
VSSRQPDQITDLVTRGARAYGPGLSQFLGVRYVFFVSQFANTPSRPTS